VNSIVIQILIIVDQFTEKEKKRKSIFPHYFRRFFLLSIDFAIEKINKVSRSTISMII